jgi:2'-5' RNA ligase
MADTLPKLEGYALWLCPAPPEEERLADLVAAIAQREGTPAFRPHLTLLGAMPGPEEQRTAQAAALARRLQPVALVGTAVTAQPDYYRGVVLEMALTRELAAARGLAAANFKYRLEPSYRPHVSLVYGDLPVLRKAEVAAELAHLASSELHGVSLEVVALEGAPGDWRTVTKLALG